MPDRVESRRVRRRAQWVAVVLLACAAGRQAPAQGVRVDTLGPALHVFAFSLTARTMNNMLEPRRYVKELADGRVVLHQYDVNQVGDPRSPRPQTLADSGGPLLSLAGDTILIAGWERGWRFFEGLRPIGVLPATNPLVARLTREQVEIRFADTLGSVYASLQFRTARDSVRFVRIDRQSGQQEVVAFLAPPNIRRGAICMDFEVAAVAPDGWLAVLRSQPYRVDWRTPAGRWILGPPVPYRQDPVSEADKRVYIAWEGKDRARLPKVPVAEWDWPATMCPWHGGYYPQITREGQVAVYRVPTAREPATRYDIIDRQGRLVRQVVMGAHQAIVGFGARGVYVLNTEGEVQRLSRHAWP